MHLRAAMRRATAALMAHAHRMMPRARARARVGRCVRGAMHGRAVASVRRDDSSHGDDSTIYIVRARAKQRDHFSNENQRKTSMLA